MTSGCSSTSAQPTIGSQEVVQPLLLFQKTPCFGPCPAYNATIFTDGSTIFVPFKNALAQDTLKLQLPAKEMLQLQQEIEALDYKLLRSSYLSGWSDISSTYLTFYENGKEVKRVKHEEGGPAPLLNFMTYVGTLLEQRAVPTY